jgi:hypothetical protein
VARGAAMWSLSLGRNISTGGGQNFFQAPDGPNFVGGIGTFGTSWTTIDVNDLDPAVPGLTFTAARVDYELAIFAFLSASSSSANPLSVTLTSDGWTEFAVGPSLSSPGFMGPAGSSFIGNRWFYKPHVRGQNYELPSGTHSGSIASFQCTVFGNVRQQPDMTPVNPVVQSVPVGGGTYTYTMPVNGIFYASNQMTPALRATRRASTAGTVETVTAGTSVPSYLLMCAIENRTDWGVGSIKW